MRTILLLLASMSVDWGPDGVEWPHCHVWTWERLPVGAGCQLRCLSSSSRLALAPSHDSGYKAPKNSEKGQRTNVQVLFKPFLVLLLLMSYW